MRARTAGYAIRERRSAAHLKVELLAQLGHGRPFDDDDVSADDLGPPRRDELSAASLAPIPIGC